MKLLISAIGKQKAGPELELFTTYIRRIPWSVEVKEFDIKKNLPPAEKKLAESDVLLKASDAMAYRIALDERGRTLSSQQFAALLGRLQDEGVNSIAFLIGGSDGHSPHLLNACQSSLSLGAMTWPHMLVRPLLAEQLFRAHAILTGHPYHRE